MNMKDQLESLRVKNLGLIDRLEDEKALAEARVRVLGRKGELTALLRGLKDLSLESRAEFGMLANKIKILNNPQVKIWLNRIVGLLFIIIGCFIIAGSLFEYYRGVTIQMP